MASFSKFVGPALIGVAMAFGAASANALEAGQCGPIADMGAKLSQEGQSAFGKGRRLSNAQETKSMHLTQPLSFGLIYFTNADRSKGYIAKTEVPLEFGPTQMCIDYAISDIQPADPSIKGPQQAFEKSPLLAEHLKVLSNLNERVMFQANRLTGGRPDGTIITATANMISQDTKHKGNGSILFTEAATGNTSRIYDAANVQYTPGGLKMLSSTLAGEVPKFSLN
ncbi:MAG: hypothetical protein JWO78_1822 [Micavibrio sp.]|nr:hypothetical protein [Micavibrio sp.]